MNNILKGLLAGAFILLIMLLLLTQCRYNRADAPLQADDIGQDGDIKITLQWDFAGDLDLHVIQPNGSEIYYMNMDESGNGGGTLDIDDREGGRGSAENAFWRRPQPGHYTVKVVYYRADYDAMSGGLAKVTVKVNGQARVFNIQLTSEGEEIVVNEFDYTPQR